MSLIPTANALFALMNIDPIERVDTIDMVVKQPDPRALTPQERQWLEEARLEGEFA